MKNPSAWIGIAVFALLVGVAGVLLLGILGEKPVKTSELDPNKGFKVEGKESYKWSFATGENLKYRFEGRPKVPGAPENLYDPESWLLTTYGETRDKAAIEFTESQVLLLQGRIESDGRVRANSYRAQGDEPAEYWQIFLNLIWLTPLRGLQPRETKTEEVEFPCMENHRVRGKATFVEKGETPLEKGGEPLRRIQVFAELRVETSDKGDRLTEYLAEGNVYWEPKASRVAAGDWEYTVGLPEERYFWPWRYAAFAREGLPFPPHLADVTALSMNVLWTVKEDIDPGEKSMRAFQKAARDQLDYLGDVQEKFRGMALVDQDGDGKGEYGLLTELSGMQGKQLRAPGGMRPWPTPRPDVGLAEKFGDVNAQGFCERDRYHFQVFLRGRGGLVTDGAVQPAGDAGNADLQEEEGGWCGYAWPAERGKTGRAAYFCNGKGNTYECLDGEWSGRDLAPRPADTGLPATGTWRRVNRFEDLPPIPVEMVVVCGKPFGPEMKKAVYTIQFYRLQMDQMAMAKQLQEPDYRRLEKIRREFDRSRGDGELTEEEATAAQDGWGEVFRDLSLRTARILLDRVALKLEKDPDPDFAKELETLRGRMEPLSKSRPDSTVILDFLQAVRDFTDRAMASEGRK